ncbi:hypothetical protein ScPMuIL_002669 [Solemya velum]
MVQSFDEFCGGEFWDESLTLNQSWPQFTECFKDTALVWGPCGWLWVTLPFNLIYLLSKKDGVPVPLSCLNVTKTLLSIVLFFVSIVDVIEAASIKADDEFEVTVPITNAVFVAGALRAATFLLSAMLMQLERRRGSITSGTLFIFWLLTMVAGIIPFYSYIIEDDKGQLFRMSLFYIYWALVFIQLILHCFAERVTRRGYHEIGKKPSPEMSASFLSRVLFWWLNGLVLTGYRKSLEETDLWELNVRDQHQTIIPVFHKAWRKEVRKSQEAQLDQKAAYQLASLNNLQEKTKTISDEHTPLLSKKLKEVSFKDGKKTVKDGKKIKGPSLFRVLAKVYTLDLFKAFGCKFVYDLLQFVSPMILNVLIAYTQNKDADFIWKGYVYASSFFLVAVLQSCLFHQNFHYGMTLGMRIRSALISAVYKKALTMSNEARKEKTVGEIVNLMSVDCQRIQDLTGYLWMLFSAPLQIGLALALLYGTLGYSVLAGLAIMILLMPINAYIAIKQRKLQVAQMKFKDARIKMMNEVLNGVKVLKLYAWEPAFEAKVNEIRVKELTVLRRVAYLNAFSNFCWACAPYLVTLATFTTFILTSESHYLNAQKAFVALSLFNILKFPINLLPMIVSYVVQANVSIGRLGKFLGSSDLDPNNVIVTDLTDNAITVTNGTFTWDRTVAPVLKNIDMEVGTGKLVAVVGQVGAGKSSLLSAFLGEMEKIEGKVTLKGSVAYVAQQAWILNETVQNNILFGKKYEKQKYDKVLESCALGPDLEILQAGDQTEIGEKGINLSGGQKQRVSVARAVYNNADVYLLDDPLSAVDSHVGKHMFQKVIGSTGLLRNKTRVLVTHGIHWLPMVDMVVVMEDGRISETGTYEELLSHDGPFAQFLKTYLTQDNDDEEDDDPEIQKIKSQIMERVDSVTSDGKTTSADEADRSNVRKRKLRRGSSESSTGLPRSISRVDKKDEAASKLIKPKDKLIEEEKSETGKVSRRVYFKYTGAIGCFASCIILLLFTIYQASAIGANIWLSQWTDDSYLKTHQNESNTTEYQDKNNLYLGVYGGLGAAQAVFVLLYSLLCSTRMVYAAGILHHGMLANILKCPMSFFDTTPGGRIINRFSRDVETIDNNLPITIRMWLNSFFATLSTLIVISYSTPIFLAVVIPIGALYYLIQKFYIPTSRQLKRMESTTRSPIYSHFSETISGASTIRAYGQQDRFIQESLERVDRNIIYYFAGIASNRWLGFRLEFIGNFIVLAAALFAVLTDVSGGVVGLSVSYALQVTGALNFLVRLTSDMETNVVSVERVKEYSESPTEAAWILPFQRPPHDWPDRGEVSYHDYSTRYRPGLDLVLKGISFDISPGQKIGIVGRTGAGKSSLTLSLFRLVEAASGSISIDGQRISEIGLHDLRTKITILPQDPVLFSGSLRKNLDPLDLYMDEHVWQALEHSHLKKFVTELPTQLDHECGEGGQNLSVGQRQLVCLARTLLRKTKILILDEATAAVDMETDDLIQQTIRTEFKECTVITIAHRLNTIMDYDRVMVLDSGKIKEFDSPGTLLQDKSSAFFLMAKDAGLAS